MIIYTDFKNSFYKVIQQSQNVVIVSYNDVDALAATFILTTMCNADEIVYSLVSVTNWEQLKNVFEEYKQAATHFILLNCGGFRSLVELDLPSNLCIFVIDSRRPFHLDNVFNEETVRLLCFESEMTELNLPEPSEIFNDEDSDASSDEEEDEQDENRMASATRRVERRMIKQKRIQAWRQRREEILWKYSNKSYISMPISVFLVKIAQSMSKMNAALTWAAAVGLSSYVLDYRISSDNYNSICTERMKEFLRQHGHGDRNKISSTLKITFERDLTLPLYRHWTLDDSIRLDPYFICHCRLWTQKGRDRIKGVYANLGIPLNECTNSFERLDTKRREEVKSALDARMQCNFGTFFSHKGFARWFSAADFARVISLKLQFSDPDKPHAELFSQALDFFRNFVEHDGGTSNSMMDALRQYKGALSSMIQLVYDSCLQKHFIQTPSLIGLTLKQQSSEIDYLRSSHCLNIFVYFALRVFYGMNKTNHRLKKPIFVAVLVSNCQQTQIYENYYLVAGEMPLDSFPRLFDELSQDKKLNVVYESINPNVIRVREDSYAEFFSRLETRLPAIS
ncbi:hypothetical protein M3Y97_00014700 [Aphelenchoides bicaudatus]|nr:hypothetical protein M3Y97_00014700 [Aphelenchoides bicaudatus]